MENKFNIASNLSKLSSKNVLNLDVRKFFLINYATLIEYLEKKTERVILFLQRKMT